MRKRIRDRTDAVIVLTVGRRDPALEDIGLSIQGLSPAASRRPYRLPSETISAAMFGSLRRATKAFSACSSLNKSASTRSRTVRGSGRTH